MTDLPDIETLLVELNRAARGVAGSSTKLARLTKEFENHIDKETGEIVLGVGARYDIALESELLAVHDEATADGSRAPAKEILAARAKQRLRQKEPTLIAERDRALTEIRALQQWISSNKQVISARQSVLNGLRSIGA